MVVIVVLLLFIVLVYNSCSSDCGTGISIDSVIFIDVGNNGAEVWTLHTGDWFRFIADDGAVRTVLVQ